MKNIPTFEQFLLESNLNEKANLEPDKLDVAKQVTKITNDFLKKDLKRLFSKYGVQTGKTYEGIQLYNAKGQAIFTIEWEPVMGYSTLRKIYRVIAPTFSNFGTLAPTLGGGEKLDIQTVRDAMPFWYNDYDLRMEKSTPNPNPSADRNSPLHQNFGWGGVAYNQEKASVLTDEYVDQYKILIDNILDGVESNLKSLQKANLL